VRVTVLYFASLRDRAGVRQEALDLAEGARVADLRAALGTQRPSVREALDSALVSVNREFALPEQPLHDGDEVAVFPPVSGGEAAPPTLLRVTSEALDLNGIVQALIRPTSGAACVFTGVVRGRTPGGTPEQTESLEYEAYPAMAEAKLEQVAREIRDRWPEVEGLAIVQRIGRLEAGTPTVLVACTAAHRDRGVFEAARYGIDRLKEIVPIWKKEIGPEGEQWVEGHYHPTSQDRSS
jgi:MoaE-MoaD fusion protein